MTGEVTRGADDRTTSGTDAGPVEEAEARAELGAAVRRLTHSVVGHHATVERLRDTARLLDELSGIHEAGARRSRPSDTFRASWDHPIADGERILTHLDRPFSGEASPWGLDIDARRVGDEVVAEVTLRAAHEGAPDRSHGGIVAALFDDVLGMVLQIHQEQAYTGELTVRFEAGTPLHTPLRLVARRTGAERRKILLEGELFDGGQRLATARAVFIRIEQYTAAPRTS